MPRIYTIGHSTRPATELVELLRTHGIRCLVDVRRYPGSRRHPQYGSDALARTLSEHGIAYVHEPVLGGRRTPRPDSVNTYWRESGFRGYADHMGEPEFRAALARLRERAEGTRLAIMCAEAVPWRCHRRLIADALVARGDDVAHIVGPGEARAHVLNEAARIGSDGTPTYPGTPEEDLFERKDEM